MANNGNRSSALHETPAVDAIAGQVRRICSSAQFASADKLQRFLEFITTETLLRPDLPLKESRIGVEVYGRPADYDPRTDAVVRVEAVKLRARLARYYDGPGKSDTIRISVPKGAYVPVFDLSDAGRAEPAPVINRRPTMSIVVLTALLTVSAGWNLYSFLQAGSARPMRLERIPAGREIAFDGALSRDGKSLVYAGRNGTDSFLNLWLRDMTTGAERRLTNHDANDSSPSFSSDGELIAFRSDEDGGGIFLVGTANGQPVHLLGKGREPRFSPSGPYLSYWIPSDDDTADFGRAFVVDVSRQHGPYPKADPLFVGFADARSPIWCDEGALMIALGTFQSDIADKEYDAWALSLQAGKPVGQPVRTGLIDLLKQRGEFTTIAERKRVLPGACDGGYLYVSTPAREASNLVRVALSANGKIHGAVEPLLPSTDLLSAPRPAPDGALTFGSIRAHHFVSSLPQAVDPSTNVLASAEAILSPSVSRDGRVVVWASELTGRGQVIRVLQRGTDQTVEVARGNVSRPVVSSDGHRVAWRAMDGVKQAIDAARVDPPGAVERICADCGQPISWTPDGKHVFFQTGDPIIAIEVLDTATRERSAVVRHPSSPLYGPRYYESRAAQREGWLTFYAANGPNTRQVFAVALQNLRPDPNAAWIPITSGRGWDVDPCWSEQGDSIYYISRQRGRREVWRQRLEANTRQPVGPPSLIRPLNSDEYATARPLRSSSGLTAAAGRLFVATDEAEGSLWLFHH